MGIRARSHGELRAQRDAPQQRRAVDGDNLRLFQRARRRDARSPVEERRFPEQLPRRDEAQGVFVSVLGGEKNFHAPAPQIIELHRGVLLHVDRLDVYKRQVILHGASVRRKRNFRGLGAYVVRGDVRVFQHGRRAVGGQIPEEQIAVEAVETVPLRGKAEAFLEKFLKLGDVAAHQNVADDV